jgi:hypothetical protein
MRAGVAAEDEIRFRTRAQGAVRLRRSQKVAGDRGDIGRGRRRRRDVQGETAKTHAEQTAKTGAAHEVLFRRQVAKRPCLHARDAAARAEDRWSGHHHRAASNGGGRARLASRVDGEESSGAAARAKAQARSRHRHPRRSGHARSIQQPVHVDCRADGRGAAKHRLFGQHQGAARFLLRGFRRYRFARRQRAAHAGASRLHGSRGRNGHPHEPRQNPSPRRLRHQRAV